MNDNRPLPAVQNQQTSLLSNDDIDPRLKAAARAIQIMGGKNKKGEYNLSEEAAIGAALYQLGTGQMIGRDFAMNDKTGRMEMYRGVSRDANERGVGEIEIDYRDMTEDELRKNEVESADTAIACEVTQLRALRIAQAASRKYKPIVGFGIVREAEKYKTEEWSDAARSYVTLPRNKWTPIKLAGGMTWYRKAQNRAYKDALRHTPGMSATPEEVIAEAATEIDGFEMPPEGARLDLDQAAAWARNQQWSAEVRNNTERRAEVLTQGAALNGRGTLQREWDEYVMGDAACPYCGTTGAINLHANTCPFRTLYPNAPKLDVVEGQFTPEGEAEVDLDDLLLTDIHDKLATYGQRSGEPASAPQKSAASASLSDMFNRDRSAVEGFLKWAYDKTRTDDLTSGEASGIIKLVSSTKQSDGTYVPSDRAMEVAGAFKRKIMGQQPLFGEE